MRRGVKRFFRGSKAIKENALYRIGRLLELQFVIEVVHMVRKSGVLGFVSKQRL